MEINNVAFREPSSSGVASLSLGETFDTFLALLTSQLQNQDPLDPLDSNQFTEQLVQFAGVEQSITTNNKLDQLLALQSSGQINSAVSYIGKTVEVIGDQLWLEDGAARISYGLDGNAAETVITIIDETGTTVRTIVGETAAGRHELAWDGRDSAGDPLPDGIYGLTVAAVDSDQNTVATLTGSTGRVTGIEVVDGLITLKLGDLGVPVDRIFAVYEESLGA